MANTGESHGLFWNSDGGDRTYDADSFSNWLKKFFTTGVFEGDLQVTNGTGMKVNVAAGYANIEGKVRQFEGTTSLTLQNADGSNGRIDTIVVEKNEGDRDISLKVVTGTASGTPEPIAPVRTGGVYQLVLAQVYVEAGATSIVQADITDKRTDPDVCGIVTGTVEEVDVSQIVAQMEDDFETWFDHMKGQLDSDAAGHLQNEIDALETEVLKPRIVIPLLSKTSFTYTGAQPELSYQYFDDDNINLSIPTMVNVGTYTITASLKNSSTDRWLDGTTGNQTQTVTINKADDVPSADPISGSAYSTMVLNVSSKTGVASATSSNTSVIEVDSISGNRISLICHQEGEATLSITTNGDENHNAASGTVAVNITHYITVTSFASATDADLATLINLADEGTIDLYEDLGWRVGDERAVTIGAIDATGTFDGVAWTVGESQAEQAATLVLMDHGSYDLVTPVLGKDGNARTKCSFVVGLKNALTTNGYMNPSNTNAGSWESSKRREWCNGGFRGAIPEAIRGIFKKFKTKTAKEYNAAETRQTEDYFALPAEKEIFGSRTYSNTTEAGELSQFEYYETAANRIKKNGDSGSAYYWWERSPYASNAARFCAVNTNGGATANSASTASGLAPFGCL